MIDKKYFGEGKNVEFKRELPKNHDHFLKDIIAFSNCTGGKVIIEIEDESNLVYGIGEVNPFKLSDSISNSISDNCIPQIEPDISFKTIEGKTVVVIDIMPGKYRPYYLTRKGKKTGAYIRINGTSRPAHENKIHELELEGSKVSFDTLQEIGSEYEEEKTIELCKEMERYAIESCETEEEKNPFTK